MVHRGGLAEFVIFRLKEPTTVLLQPGRLRGARGGSLSSLRGPPGRTADRMADRRWIEQAAARRHGAPWNRLGTMSCYSKISESLHTAYTARQDITYQFAETHDTTWANVWGRIGGTVPPGALLAPY